MMRTIAKLFVFALVSFGLCGGLASVVQAQAKEAKPYEVAVSDTEGMSSPALTSTTVQNGVTSNIAATNCRYYYRYYRPVVYYRPAVYYRPMVYQPVYYPVHRPVCYYGYRYVVFYNGVSSNEPNGQNGILMEKTPDANTALGKQRIQQGDIITHINGKMVKSHVEIDSITENSKLTVLKKSVDTGNSADSSDVLKRFFK